MVPYLPSSLPPDDSVSIEMALNRNFRMYGTILALVKTINLDCAMPRNYICIPVNQCSNT